MRRKMGRVFSVASLSVVGLLGVGYAVYTHRPQPNEIHEDIFRGVTYDRLTFRSPRPMVAHIVTVDLAVAKPRFFTTPPVPGLKYPYQAQAVSTFLKDHRLQLAINADFFKPYWGRGPWDYYPHFGDAVYSRGLSMHEGDIVTPPQSNRPSLFFSKDGRVSFDPLAFAPYDAISGESIYLRDGKWSVREPDTSYWRSSIQPRCSVGLSKDGRSLLIAVVDGRQPGYSEGCTVHEMADILVRHGAGTMLDLDGGGSETLVKEGRDGKPYILNCPIDSWIPNRERPVATQLGLWLEK